MPTDLSKITMLEAADQAINRRAEMWMKTKEWLEDQAGAQIPDSDHLQADACGPRVHHTTVTPASS